MDPRTPTALLLAQLPSLDGLGYRAAALLRDAGVALRVETLAAGVASVTVRDAGGEWTVGAAHAADAVSYAAQRLGRLDVVRWLLDAREALCRAETVPAPAHNDSSNEVSDV